MTQELRRDEAVIPYAYPDSLGYLTIGVGRLIDKRKGGRLSDDEIDYLLSNDIKDKVADLDRQLPWWRTLTENRQRVLVNMAFNLGIDGLLQFRKMLIDIQNEDYVSAANEMKSSRWATQVGARATRLETMMTQG